MLEKIWPFQVSVNQHCLGVRLKKMCNIFHHQKTSSKGDCLFLGGWEKKIFPLSLGYHCKAGLSVVKVLLI